MKTERFCCDQQCSQGRDCPRRAEFDDDDDLSPMRGLVNALLLTALAALVVLGCWDIAARIFEAAP